MGDGNDKQDTLEALRHDETHQAAGDVSGHYHDKEKRGVHRVAGRYKDDEKEEREQAKEGSMLIIVMGVSGCGKSTLGAALATSLRLPFEDADALHPQANIEKMSAGVPLTDEDRKPWLELVRATAVKRCDEQAANPDFNSGVGDEDYVVEGNGQRGVVVGCSTLKKSYRDILRGHTHDAPSTHPDVPHPQTSSANGNDSAEPVHTAPPHPSALPTYFVFIRGDRDALLERMEHRTGHFMKAGMLDSQLRTLENPEDEPDVVVVELESSTEEQVRNVREGLNALGVKL